RPSRRSPHSGSRRADGARGCGGSSGSSATTPTWSPPGRTRESAPPSRLAAGARDQGEAVPADPEPPFQRLAELLGGLEQGRPPAPGRRRPVAVHAGRILDLADELQALGVVLAHTEPHLDGAEVLAVQRAVDRFLDLGGQRRVLAADRVV